MNKKSAPQHNAQSPATTKGPDPLELSAAELIQKLDEYKGNLSDLCYTVGDPVEIGDELKGYDAINLGHVRFEGGLSIRTKLDSLDFGQSTIRGNLDFNESSISEVNFGEAKLYGEVSFGDLKADTINFGNAEFFKKITFMHTSCIALNGGSATFHEIVHLGSLHATSFNCGESTFETLHLGEFWTNLFTPGKATVVTLEHPTDGTLHCSGERGDKDAPQINNVDSTPPEERPKNSLAAALEEAIAHYREVNSPHK